MDLRAMVFGMGSGFEIAREAMGQEASRMRIHGEDYAAAVRRLRERGSGGASWGDDGLLSMLVGPYAEASTLGLEAMTGLSGVIDGTGETMNTVLANTDAAEAASIEQSNGLYGARDPYGDARDPYGPYDGRRA
ncbi:hypothetical protein [Streptosporangium sp. NPDC051022]|uniref:hypothetical protein n=1 Tax=Streptosporangium sp. NPDC051022 TaxID=3155752 RepID=UPI0034236CE6